MPGLHIATPRRLSPLLLGVALTVALACSSSNNANTATRAATTAPAATQAAASSAASRTATPGGATTPAAATGGNVAVPASVIAADKALAAAAGSGSPIDQVSISQPVTINFWHVSSDSSDAGKKLTALIADFQAKNPNIKVNAQYIGNYNDLFQKIQTGLAGGQTPDLAVAYENQVSLYQTANVIIPLEDYVKSQKYGLPKDDYADLLQAYRYDNFYATYQNHLLSFPWTKSIELMYYRADKLKAAGVAVPQTWDDFVKAAKAVTTGNVKGYTYGTDASRFMTGEYTRGGAVLSEDQKKWVFNNQQGIDQLAMYQQMLKDGSLQVEAKQYDNQAAFAQGTTVFNFSSSAGMPFYASDATKNGNYDWEVALPPHAAGVPATTDMYGPNITMFKSSPEKQLAAWLFIKYFTSKDVNPDWAVATGYLPIRTSGLSDDRVKAQVVKEPQYGVALQGQQYGQPEPNVRQYDAVRTIIQNAMVAATTDPTKSPKALLDDAVNQANQAMSQ